MFEASFKRIDQILRTDSGSATELDYVEQTSWILFLKYLDDLEETKKTGAALAGKKYTYMLDKQYQWDTWAAPKTAEGKIDHQKALDGDDLKDFVNDKLFPYLRKFRSEEPDTIEYKIGEIFSELKNKISSGYKLREILNIVDGMHFQRYEEKHELSHLYEDKIKNMGNAGRNGGEYYTPRPLIKTIVKVVDPQIGDKIYDGACGSAGFLVEAYDYLTQNQAKLNSSQLATLQNKTFYGKEIKSLAYIIGIMNMILHGIEAPNIKHADTLAQNINDIQDKDRYDVVLANPPFGAGISREIQQNFPIKSGETAFLFVQHFIKSLKAGGRAGIVIKNTFLSNTDNAAVALRKMLLETCNVHTILELPKGSFPGAAVKTVVLFFEKGRPTENIWFYQLNLKRTPGKTNPLLEQDLADFLRCQKNKEVTGNSWNVSVAQINKDNFDLAARNPNKINRTGVRETKAILKDIKVTNQKGEKALQKISKLEFKEILPSKNAGWEWKRLDEVSEKITQGPNPKYDGKEDDNFRVLKTKDLYDDVIHYGNADRMSERVFNEHPSAELKNGDVLVAIVGQGSINKCNVFEEQKPTRFIYTRALGLIRTKKDILDPYFLKAFLQSEYGKELINAGIGGTSGQQVVTTTHIKAIKIPIPSLKEQKNLIKKLDSLSNEMKDAESIFQKNLSNLKELKHSVVKDFFSEEASKKVSVPKAKELVPSAYKRNQVHAAIIEQVAKDGGWTTEVAVAKYDHLLQEVYGLTLGYQFADSTFGPFDAEIKKLVSSGLGRNRWFTKRHGMVVFGDNVSSLLSHQSNLYRSAKNAMSELSRLGITKLDADRVELLSTICHSIKMTGSTTLESVRAYMEQWPTDNNRTKAEKFSEEQTSKCLDFINRNGLHRPLLQTV